jgi:hypothetical protein
MRRQSRRYQTVSDGASRSESASSFRRDTKDPGDENPAPDAPPTVTTSAGGGLSGYFTNTLPRKWTLTGLIAGSPPLPVPAPPQISSMFEERWAGPAEGSLGSAMEALSSSIPPRPTQQHAGPSHGSSANSIRGGKGGRPPLDVYLTHTTPFGSTPYIPPSGAPGFEGDRRWDKGGFAEDWDKEQAQEKEWEGCEGQRRKLDWEERNDCGGCNDGVGLFGV